MQCVGAGRPGWAVVEHDEENMVTYWEMDLIGGAVHENERNALLCDEVKEAMYDWNKNWGYVWPAAWGGPCMHQVMCVCHLRTLLLSCAQQCQSSSNNSLSVAVAFF